MRRARSNALVLIAAVSALSVAAARQDEKVVPVYQEPRHHVVFETPGTRILDIQIPPGDTTLFHTHSDPILYVNMSSSQTRSQTLGREWSGGGAAATRSAPVSPGAPSAPVAPSRGRMNSVTSYAQQPLTHRVNNIGGSLFRLIGVTNASPGDDTSTPGRDFEASPELENRWFRGYHWPMAAKLMTVEHRHANPVAIVLVSGRAVVSGAATTTLDQPGAFAWVEAEVGHRIQAVSDADLIEIEVRRPPAR